MLNVSAIYLLCIEGKHKFQDFFCVYISDAASRRIWRMDRNNLRLLSRELLNNMTSRYTINVLGTDATFTATTTITVNVDRE